MGGSFTFQTIDRGGGHEFSGIRIRKSADLIPDAYKCVFGKGAVAIFLTLMGGGGVMQFYHLGIERGQRFFSYSGALSATPPPLKFMNSPLTHLHKPSSKTTVIPSTVAMSFKTQIRGFLMEQPSNCTGELTHQDYRMCCKMLSLRPGD